MRGPEDAATLVVSRLEAKLPTQLAAIETARGLAANTIPRPVTYLPHDLPQLPTDVTPAVLVVVQDTPDVSGREPGDGTLRWDVTYRMRIYVFARGQGYRDTDQHRKRLVLGVRQTLLAEPAVGEDAHVVPSRWRESYSDVVAEDRSRSLAGAYLEANVVLAETLPLASWGTVATTLVEEGLLAPHPAL